MGKGARNRREAAAPTEAAPVTWADAHALLTVTVTDADRLDLWAGDGEEGPEAPESVRREPSLLLAWCQRYSPAMVADDETAQTSARNRTMSEVVHAIRRRDPKLQVTPAHVVAELTGDS